MENDMSKVKSKKSSVFSRRQYKKYNKPLTNHSVETELNAKETFLSDILKRRKKTTYKGYKRGIELFEEYSQKDCDRILAEAKQKSKSENVLDLSYFDREIEAFYKWMIDKGYALTSSRNNTLGIVQFFNFYRIPINSKIPMPPPTTKTYIPKIDELRRMFQTSDLKGKVVLSLGLDFAWRIVDFVNLKKTDIPDLNQETPIGISQVTQKENVISATFISSETVELLKAYLPTLQTQNEYLFPSTMNGSHMKDESLNKILKVACQKAKIQIPKGKRFTFHSLRKRFLSTCATLNIDSEYAKLMVGKSTELGSSFETYLQDADFKEAFKKVREDALSLSNGTIKTTMEGKDAKITELSQKVNELELLLKTMTGVFGDTILKQAQEQLASKGLASRPLDPYEALQMLAEFKKEKDKREYDKLLEEKNGLNGTH